jgi:hypothetical protein
MRLKMCVLAAAAVFCSSLSVSGQMMITGKVWLPKTPEAVDEIPPQTGIAENYFAQGRVDHVPGLKPVTNVRCFGTPEGLAGETMASITWEVAPSGWYRLTGTEGRYTLLFSGPSRYVRPTVLTNFFMDSHDVVDLKVVPEYYYALFHDGDFDRNSASHYYQTFIAKGTGVTSIGFKLAHDGVDGDAQGSQTLVASIHRAGPGTPDEWKQIGPATLVPKVDAGGPKQYEWSAHWNSGDVPTTPGQKYAVCIRAEQEGGTFQTYWRPGRNERTDCYRLGPKGETGWVGRNLWMYVGGDGDGLLIPYNKGIYSEFSELTGFARKWSQTYVAQGRSLASVILYTATSGLQPSITRQRAIVRVREGGPEGPCVGIEKIAIGQGSHVGDASWGVFGATFAPGEVELTPGQTYAIELESIENYASIHGYINKKGLVSDDRPGFNPYKKHPADEYEAGTAYKNGQEEMDYDLDMQIIEYQSPSLSWSQRVEPENLLVNGNMEQGELDPEAPEKGKPAGWQTFSSDDNTVHQYRVSETDKGNRFLRVSGGLPPKNKSADGGFVQSVSGLNHLDTYRVTGLVRTSWRADIDHLNEVGIDLTGQTSDPQADTIQWTPVASIHSYFVRFTSEPIRTESGKISIWLRAWARSGESYPYHVDFDEFGLYTVATTAPGIERTLVLPRSSDNKAVIESDDFEQASRAGLDAVAPPWLALADYPRPAAPDTGWGIHDFTDCQWTPDDPDAFFDELKSRWGFSWFKVLACGLNKMEVVRAASRHGVEPVVRIYAPGPHPLYPRPGREEREFRAAVRAYVQAGAHYFEAGNEPNLGGEWSPGEADKPDQVGRLCKQWLRVKRIIEDEGGIAVFYAMTPGSAGQWWKDCFDRFQKWGKLEEAFAGAAFGAHLGPANHPLDYPFNPKKNMPHATQEERLESLLADNTCYLAGELIMLLMDKYLPYPIPILSTEGGAFLDEQPDKNYPKVTLERHRELNMGIFNRFNPSHPEYWGDPLFAQMSWAYGGTGGFLFSGWFDHPEHGNLPILDAMEEADKFDRGVAFE